MPNRRMQAAVAAAVAVAVGVVAVVATVAAVVPLVATAGALTVVGPTMEAMIMEKLPDRAVVGVGTVGAAAVEADTAEVVAEVAVVVAAVRLTLPGQAIRKTRHW
jgi:hypothetical protein